MPKFRKRPVVIEATQLEIGKPTPEGVNYGHPEAGHPLNGQFWIHTLEGPLIANVGDWIIIGVKGEKYACKEDIFWLTYEEVVE